MTTTIFPREIKETSIEAYKQIQEKITGRHRIILDILEQLGPSTDTEIAEALGESDPNYVRPRRNELVKMGMVSASGKRECCVTHKTAFEWEIVQ